MISDAQDDATLSRPSEPSASQAPQPAKRITSRDLLGQARELEIDHDGRIYRLRLTKSDKLILTA